MKKLAKSVATLALVVSSVGLIGCESQQEKSAKSVEQLLKDGTGKNWQRSKSETKVDGYAVFFDPYEKKYVAFDVSKYHPGITYDQFMAISRPYSGLVHTTEDSWTTDINGNDVEVTLHWYTDPVSGITFEVGDSTSKDLEAISASIEMAGASAISQVIAANYGLSEERAGEIANLAQTWQSLEKSRAMTAKDLAEFQTEVFGADLGSISKAARASAEGDSREFNKLVAKAAELNGVSVEQAKKIVSDFVQ